MDEGNTPVHLGTVGITAYVEPIDTGDVVGTIQANVDTILDAVGIACINHPRWERAFDHQAILETRGASPGPVQSIRDMGTRF